MKDVALNIFIGGAVTVGGIAALFLFGLFCLYITDGLTKPVKLLYIPLISVTLYFVGKLVMGLV